MQIGKLILATIELCRCWLQWNATIECNAIVMLPLADPDLIAKGDQMLDFAAYQFPEFNNFNRWAAHPYVPANVGRAGCQPLRASPHRLNNDPKDSDSYKKA